MTVLQRLIRNIATNWFSLVVNIVVSFFLAPFVVNKLGSTYYGVWAITLQFTGYLYLMDFGVRDAVVRYASKYRAIGSPTRLNEIIRVALEIYFPVFLTAVVLSVVGAWAFPFLFSIDELPLYEVRIVVAVVGLTIAQTFVVNVFVGVLHGFQRFDIGNYVGVFAGLLRAVLTILILNSGYGVVGLSVVQLSVTLIGGALGFLFTLKIMEAEGFRYRWIRINHRRRVALVRRMVGYSVFVFINNIGQKTNSAAGPIIIGIFLPVAAVTPYAIAGNLANYVRSLILSSSWVFNPVVSHYASLKDTTALVDVVRRGAKLPLIVGLPVTIAFILVGDTFISLWMGPQYVVEAASVLIILAIMETMSAPHHVMAAALYGMSKHQSLAYFRVLEAVCNVVLSILLVKSWGIVGVAVGSLVPHLVVVLIMLPYVISRNIGVSTLGLMRGIFFRPLVGVVPYALSLHWVFKSFPPESLVAFFVEITLVLPTYFVAVLLVSMDSVERQALLSRLKFRFSGPGGADISSKGDIEARQKEA